MAPDTPVSATLDDIRVRVFAGNYDDAPHLLAAVEAVLEKAGEWDTVAAVLDASADHERLTSAAEASARTRTQKLRECAGELREAITAALAGTGKGASDE